MRALEIEVLPLMLAPNTWITDAPVDVSPPLMPAPSATTSEAPARTLTRPELGVSQARHAALTVSDAAGGR